MFAMIKKFSQMQSFGGILHFFTALLAMVVANSPIVHWYFD